MNAPGPTFESAANDALAKKCDELEAENARLRVTDSELQLIRAMIKSRVPVGQDANYLDEHDACGAAVSALLSRLDEVKQVFEDYMIEGDETLRDVCARLTHANVELRDKLQQGKNWKSAYDELAATSERLVKERDEQQAKRYAIEQAVNTLAAAWRHKGPRPYDPGTLFADELAAALDSAVSSARKKPDPVTPDFPSDIKTPTPRNSIASAAERAAGKVSGPAQAALMALAVELRRGT